jgi:hypothetical protein
MTDITEEDLLSLGFNKEEDNVIGVHYVLGNIICETTSVYPYGNDLPTDWFTFFSKGVSLHKFYFYPESIEDLKVILKYFKK